MSTHSDGIDEWFPQEARAGLASFWDACAGHYKRANAEIRRSLVARKLVSSADAAPSEQEQESLARDQYLLEAMHAGVQSGSFTALETVFAEVGARWSKAGIELTEWYEVSDLFRQQMLSVLFEHYRADPERLQAAVLALQRYADNVTRIITNEYVREHEQRLLAQRRRTEEAWLRYKRLDESGIIGILVSDIFGHAKEANDGFLQMLGYSREELLGLNWIELTPPEWRHLDQDAVAQLKATGRTRPWEKEYIRKDGTRVPVLVGVALLNDLDGIAFVLDISERKRLEQLHLRSQELEAQNLRIVEANRLKSEFLANMSHELRTPLNSIIGFSELLYDGAVARDSPQYKDFLGHILTGGRQLLQLINDLLDLAKIESGKLTFRPEPVRIGQLVDEVCAVLRPVASDRNIALDYHVESAVEDASLDPSRFKQVLYNYVSNALKFTEAGGAVRLSVRVEGSGMLRIEVVDTGIGIAAGDLARLFARFQQLDGGQAKRHPGTGLGLALVKRIVEAQGGEVGVSSVLGKGSTFFAILPTHVPPRSEAHG